MPLSRKRPAAAIAAAPMTLEQKLELFRTQEDVTEPLPKLTVPEQKRLHMKFEYELESNSAQDENALIANAVALAPVGSKQKTR